jgi:hypothetical protein
MESIDDCATVDQFKTVTMLKGFNELILMRDENHTSKQPSQIIQFLNDRLSSGAIQAPEPLVNDDAFDRTMLLPGILANS